MQARFDARSSLKQVQRRISDLQRKQIPFATAQALTATARIAQASEKEILPSLFDRPTPFTINSVAVTPAKKTALTAIVFYRDIAAEYLLPFEIGGVHALGNKKAILTPIAQGTNQYGNLPRSKIAQLAAKPNVFIGPVTFKSGQTVSGVWQRSPVKRGARRNENGKRGLGQYGPKGAHSKIGGASTTLKLLIEFDDPKPVAIHLGFRERVIETARRNIRPEFQKAMAKAMATAR